MKMMSKCLFVFLFLSLLLHGLQGLPLAESAEKQDAKFEKALRKMESGKVNEAITLLEKIIGEAPENQKALSLLGVAYSSTGKFEKAVEALKKAVDLDPIDLQARKNLGNLYTDLKLFDEAIIQHRKRLELSPDSCAALNDLAVALFQKGDMEEGKSLLVKAVGINPVFAQGHVNLGLALMKESRWQAALDEFILAQAIDFSGYGLQNMLKYLAKEGYPDLAKDAADHDSDPYVHHRLAYCLAYRDKMDEAIKEIEKAIAIDTTKASFHYAKALFLTNQDQVWDAVAVLDAALAAQPDDWPCMGLRGELALILGLPAEALEYLKKADSLQPEVYSTLVNLGGAYASLETHSREIGETETAANFGAAAISAYKRGLTLAPGNALLNFNLAAVFTNTKQYEEAWIYARKAEASGHPEAKQLISTLKSRSREPD